MHIRIGLKRGFTSNAFTQPENITLALTLTDFRVAYVYFMRKRWLNSIQSVDEDEEEVGEIAKALNQTT